MLIYSNDVFNMDTQPPINYQINVSNSTNSPILLEYNANLNDAILKNPENYLLSVTRADIPSSLIETLNIPDNTNYWVGIRGAPFVAPYTQANYTCKLPNDNPLSVDSDKYYGVVKYYNNTQILNVISRCYYIAHNKLIKASPTNKSWTWDSSRLFDNSNGAISSFSMTNVVSGIHSNARLSHLEFTIKEFIFTEKDYLYSTNQNTTDNRDYQEADQSDTLITITLTAPNADQIILFSDYAKNLYLSKGSTFTVCFSEGSFLPYLTDLATAKLSGKQIMYLPNNETYAKLYGLNATNSNGTWTLSVQNKFGVSVKGNFKFQIDAHYADVSYPYIPPAFAIDNKNIEIAYHKDYVLLNSTKIIMSPIIKRWLDFGVSQMVDMNGYYWLNLPAPNGTTTPILIETQQENSTLHRMTNLSRLIISTNNIDVNGDVNASTGIQSNRLASNQSLMDFILEIPQGADSLENLNYSTDASIIPWRRYELSTTTPLKNININLYVEYSDGSFKPVYLAAGRNALIRLSFFKK